MMNIPTAPPYRDFVSARNVSGPAMSHCMWNQQFITCQSKIWQCTMFSLIWRSSIVIILNFYMKCSTFALNIVHGWYIYPGAYEPPKAAKERATTTYARVPSKYKYKRNNFQIWKVRVYWNWLLPRPVPHLNLYFDGTQVTRSWSFAAFGSSYAPGGI